MEQFVPFPNTFTCEQETNMVVASMMTCKICLIWRHMKTPYWFLGAFFELLFLNFTENLAQFLQVCTKSYSNFNPIWSSWHTKEWTWSIEVTYSCNFFGVSDSPTCPDIISWFHSGNTLRTIRPILWNALNDHIKNVNSIIQFRKNSNNH